MSVFYFCFNDPPTTEIYTYGPTLSLHAALPIPRMVRDRAAFLPLPSAAYDACDKRPGRVSPLSLVRYRGNDYSVPVAYGHREVLVRGYVERVVISCAAEEIGRAHV